MTRQIRSTTSQDINLYVAKKSVNQSDINPSIKSIDDVYKLAIQKLERKDFWFSKKLDKVAEVILLTSMPHFPPTIPHELVQSVHRKLCLIVTVLHEDNIAIRIRSSEPSSVLSDPELHVFHTILKRLIRNDILPQKLNDNRDLFLLLKRPMIEILNDIDFLHF